MTPATLQTLASPLQRARPLAFPARPDGLSAAPRVAATPAAVCPAHLHRLRAGGVVFGDGPLPLLPGGAAAPFDHAGPVPHDLRLRVALLRSPPTPCVRRRHRPGVLQIRDAKGGKDRQLPVSAPLRERLSGYAQAAGRSGSQEWFFPGSRPGSR